MTIFLKTEDEIELMRKANLLVSATLGELGRQIKSGITARQLSEVAELFIRDSGAIPVLKNISNPYGMSFPASISILVNGKLVQGMSDDKTAFNDGDIVSIGCGALLNGFTGYSCYTYCVGDVCSEVKALQKATKEALYLGIENAVAGRHAGDIGYAIRTHGETSGFCVVNEFAGHGIGQSLQEAPKIPNSGKRGYGILLKEGMCVVIEPMLALKYINASAKLCVRMAKESIEMPVACFGHSVVIRNGRAEILSSFDEVEQLEAKK